MVKPTGVFMLSGKLIRLIENHEEQIGSRIINDIRRDPALGHLAGLPEAELRERGREILQNLGHWLAFENEEKLEREYEGIGKLRYDEAIPLEESIRGLFMIKYRMIDFIHEEGLDRDCVALYAEEELERRVARFFDTLVIHLARGYETEWRLTMATV
jgi:hypothetical protein